MAYDNRSLGRFELVGIPPAPRGVPQIEVTFEIDANGIVHVSARDLATGKEQSIRITASSGLAQAEIDKMVREAELYHQDDLRKKKVAELRNNLDGLIYTTSKSLEEYGNYFQDEEYNDILQALEEAQRVIDHHPDDYELLRDCYQALEESSYRIAEAMYAIAAENDEYAGEDHDLGHDTN